jgi:hypothetical protein
MKDFYFGTDKERRKFSSQGKIRRIYSGVYTSIKDDERLHKVMMLQWPLIVAHAFRNCVIAYRSAIEFKSSPQGYIYLISKQSKTVDIGGIRFRLIRGTPDSASNRKALMGANTSCRERAFLDSLVVSKNKVSDDRYMPVGELENKLEEILTLGGEVALNSFREKSYEISLELGLKAPCKRLDGIIGTLLGSKDTNLQGKRAIGRASGFPSDEKRIDLFLLLAGHLETVYFPELKERNISNREHFENKAFFESYFSNYIEGTEFLIDEAEQIILDRQEIYERPEDSHDIAGTFKIVSDRSFMTSPYNSYTDFEESLRFINRTILSARKGKYPGEFKKKPNQAGSTQFVHPDYVEGTLMKAYEIGKTINSPVARGIFLSYAVSEIHPFADGNGRTCRIVLNKVLLSGGFSSIIIPTVFRDDYLLVLRALSRKGRPVPIVTMFLKAFRFSHLDFSDYRAVKKEITQKNWFLEPEEGKIIE